MLGFKTFDGRRWGRSCRNGVDRCGADRNCCVVQEKLTTLVSDIFNTIKERTGEV